MANIIIIEENNSNFQCNICCDEFDISEKCVLDCNDEHYFCKKCINDWYNETCKKGFTTELYSCPICKKYGGYNVLKKSKDKPTYESFMKTMNERCITHCLCRNDNINNPYTEAKFCRINLSLMNNYYYGGTVTFADNTKIGLCKDHYKEFEEGKTLYHFFHQNIFKEDDSTLLEKEDNKKSFDWEKNEVMSINHSKKCVAKTKLGHRCTKKYHIYYVNKITKESLFLCPIHEKKLINDNTIKKFQLATYPINQ